MLGEAVGIARRRRWVFLIPAAIGMAAALAYSFTYTRVYEARTMFERRDSPVMSNLIRNYEYNPYSFPKLRASIYVDIKGFNAMSKAAEQAGLDAALPHDGKGELTEQGRRIKQTMVNALSTHCLVYLHEETDTRDLITVQLPHHDPELARKLVTRLRDNYVERVRAQMSKLLTDAQEYFRKTVAKKSEEVRELEADMVEFRSAHSGVDPADPDAVVHRLSALIVQREDLTRRIEELETDIQLNEQILGKVPASTTRPGIAVTQPALMSVRVAAPARMTNPAHAEKRARIEQLRAEMIDKTVTMTDEHPQVRRLRLKISQLDEELSRIPQTVSAPASARAGTAALRNPNQIDVGEQLRRQERIRAEAGLRSLRPQLARTKNELKYVQGQIAQYEAQKTVAFERREEYLRRQDRLVAARNELAAEQKNHNHVADLRNAEANERGIIFNVLEETLVSPKPVSPKALRTILVSLGVGVALGLACVLLLELLDRTYRSVGHVAAELQLPVLQTIGEIVSPELRRRRMVRQVALHAATAALIMLVCVTSGLVYLSLEKPRKYRQLLQANGLVSRELIGVGP